MSRGQFAGVLLAGLVFVVGALTLVQQLGSLTSNLAKQVTKSAAPAAKDSQPTTIDNANFAYLVPGQDPAWSFDNTQTAFDQGKGIVKYVVKLTNANIDATISQQAMPDQLKPKDSPHFDAFINDAKPTRSQKAGAGTLYYLPALQNGAPANGSDTVIYATDGILMFGRSAGVLGYDAWSKMIATMHPIH